MSDTKIQHDDSALRSLTKAFGKSKTFAKIGVLGKPRMTKDGKTNAEIGLKHEFGTAKLPIRSFLRMPLETKFNMKLEASNIFKKDTIKEVLKEKTLEELIRAIGVIGESTVLDAFDTGGFGQWPPSNMKYKKVHQTLVETQNLRNSITHEVVVDK